LPNDFTASDTNSSAVEPSIRIARHSISAPIAPADPNAITIPAELRFPLSLKQAISTKNAREGDAVYAQTHFRSL